MNAADGTDDADVFPSQDRYRVRDPLGQGATGAVFRAFDAEFACDVALKVLRPSSTAALSDLKREFRFASDLDHPNVVRLYELDARGDRPFFTMEYVDGVDFATWCHGDRSRVPSAVAQLLRGLRALHRSELIHRDLKPRNVLVTPEGRVVVLDFGLATRAAPVPPRASGPVLAGTPFYLAPELVTGAPASAATDAYAVGLMLHQALGGRLPPSRNWGELLHWKRTGTLEPVAGDALWPLVERLVAPNPTERATIDEALATIGPLDEIGAHVGLLAFGGRRDELANLRAALERVRAGTGHVLEVRGESGVGKTRLVSEFLREVGAAAIVLEGRCHPNEHVAYRALDRVMSDLHDVLVSDPEAASTASEIDPALYHLFPRRSAPDGVRERGATEEPPGKLLQRAIAALRKLLAGIATPERPVVLFIDDAQWTGEDGAALLRDLLAQPNSLCVLTILGTRESLEHALPSLAGVVDETLELGRLSPDASREVLRGLGIDEARLADIVRASEGDAYLLSELARAHAAGAPEAREPASALARRLEPLDREERDVLERLAVAGRPLRVGELDTGERRALASLRDRHLVRPDGVGDARGFVPAHDRIRAHLLAGLSVEALAHHHRLLADRLIAGAGPAELVVLHLRAAGDVRQAYPFALRAGVVAAESLAFAQSAALFQQAFELAPEAERGACRRRLAEALARAGFGAESAMHYLALAQQADASDAVMLQQSAAEQLLFSGQQRGGMEAMSASLARVGESMPRSRMLAFAALMLRAVQLRPGPLPCTVREPPWDADELRRIDVLHTASLGLSMSEAILSSALGLRHLDASVAAGEPGRLSRAIAIQLAQLAAFRYDPSKTAALQAQGLSLAERAGSAESLALVRLAGATAAWMEGRFEDSYELVTAVGERLENDAPGLRFHRDSAKIVLLAALQHTGRWRELGLLVPEISSDATRRGDLYLQVNVKVRAGAARWIARDEPERGIAEIDEGSEKWPRRSFDLTDVFAVHGRATCWLYAGRAREALREVDAAIGPMRRSFLFSVGFLRTMILEVRARSLLADAIAARRAPPLSELRGIARALVRIASPLSAHWAEALRSEIARLEGDAGAARAALDRAIAGYRAAGMRLEAAAGTLRLATADGDVQRTDDALKEIRDAGVREPAKLARALFPTLALQPHGD